MASITSHKLNTGKTIPAIGFGTWQDKDAQEEAVTHALKAGYRHIDTARMWVTKNQLMRKNYANRYSYGTEPAVGVALKKSGIPRSELL